MWGLSTKTKGAPRADQNISRERIIPTNIKAVGILREEEKNKDALINSAE